MLEYQKTISEVMNTACRFDADTGKANADDIFLILFQFLSYKIKQPPNKNQKEKRTPTHPLLTL